MAIHKPVLPKESVDNLNLREGSVVVDATLGGGGHSRKILERIGDKGTLIAVDIDIKALESFIKFPIKTKNIRLVNKNFSDLENILLTIGIEKVDAILADLGYSSDQLEDEEIGMSFTKDSPLDMRLDRSGELSARDVVNDYSEENLEKVIREYGEEKFWRRITKAIINARKIKPIETTAELSKIITRAVPEKYTYGKIHEATRTFQAIRIEVNRELENLKVFIPQAIEALSSGGRLAIISFHSLEDRIVKRQYKENAGGCICPPEFPKCQCGRTPKIRIITKKPVKATDLEVADNPRARSAKLRVCEKI